MRLRNVRRVGAGVLCAAVTSSGLGAFIGAADVDPTSPDGDITITMSIDSVIVTCTDP